MLARNVGSLEPAKRDSATITTVLIRNSQDAVSRGVQMDVFLSPFFFSLELWVEWEKDEKSLICPSSIKRLLFFLVFQVSEAVSFSLE